MAERRMFAKSIVLSDAFLDMPLSSRCLYFTLSMLADDDGFVNSPKSIMRQCGASQDDMSVLLQKKFVLPFDSGVIVIRHWRINNYLRSDRYTETKCLDEKEQLVVDKTGAYEFGIPGGIPGGIPSINNNITLSNTTLIDKPIDKKNVDNTNDKNYVEIIDYLNLKTGSSYRYSTKSIREYINGRLREGYTVDDFKTVIDKKCLEWEGTDQEQYLRPSTLFAPKHFAEYLNQPVKKAKKGGFGFADIDWSTI